MNISRRSDPPAEGLVLFALLIHEIAKSTNGLEKLSQAQNLRSSHPSHLLQTIHTHLRFVIFWLRASTSFLRSNLKIASM